MYDAEHIARFYNDAAEREWHRFQKTPADQVSLYIHHHYLQQHIHSGDHVLEAGAGPGRFTISLAELGARITVGDISPVQLELNARNVAAAGWEESIVERRLLDVVSMPELHAEKYDAVVCYGGPVSYALEHGSEAVGELFRVVRPGGIVLLSVMSSIGTTHRFLPGILEVAAVEGLDVVERIWQSGDLYGAGANGHHCHMYRWTELQTMLRQHPCDIIDVSAANFLTGGHDESLATATENPQLWNQILAWELDACRQPGALDGGTHIIVVLRRTESLSRVE